MKRLGALLLVMVATAGIMAFVVLMGSLIFPGALKWTSSTVCTDSAADPVVVRDTYQTEPGETSTNFTLYCVGSRGEIENAGFGKPVGTLMVWGIAAAMIPVIVVFLLGSLARLRRGGDAGGGGGSGGVEETGGYSHEESVADSPENTGTLADPIEGYGGQPPLIS